MSEAIAFVVPIDGSVIIDFTPKSNSLNVAISSCLETVPPLDLIEVSNRFLPSSPD